MIATDRRLAVRLRAATAAASAVPRGFLETLPRMMYLSSVTITTLGYGDLVPIRNASRMLVAVEALLGPVLLGFALNAVARRREH